MIVARPESQQPLSATIPKHRLSDLRRLAETLAIAAAGGVALGLTGFPAGWLSGAILLVAVAAFAGRPLLMPALLTRSIFVLIGISLGAVVTPETLRGMASYPLSIVVLIVAMVLISLSGTLYLRVVHRWNLPSAYLASSPGGLSQVLVVAAELGADLRAIAIVQSMRVMIIAVGLPAGLTLFGFAGHAARRGNGPWTWALGGELAVLVAASVIAGIAAFRFRFPGGLLFGAMFASAALHGSGLVHAVVPPWVANIAMVALGAVVGARFANTPLRLLANYLGAAFSSLAIAVTIAAIFAAGLIHLLSLPVSEVMIAFAPGSVDAMMLLALALHLDPVYVGAHHVMRIVLVSLVMPFIARRLAHKPLDESKAPSEPPTFQD
ncbi:MAG TPA: AbrB family transcriptional regulator [Pseudolabrys sp.]|nr:AbrB family transcriptional regulator [Pseudolabrys sp.]